MKDKKHKCQACGKVRFEIYMTADSITETKKGRQKIIWQCGDCEEENRGRNKK